MDQCFATDLGVAVGEIPAAVVVVCGVCGDGSARFSGFVAFEDVYAGEGVGVGIEGGGAEESARAIKGKGDTGGSEFVFACAGMFTDEQRGDLGDDEFHIDDLEPGECDCDDEDRPHHAVEADAGGHQCDELSMLGHLRECEAHRADEDHADEEVVELEELWPPEIGDEEDCDECLADGSGFFAGILNAELVGEAEEAVEVEGDIDDQYETEENQQERTDIKEVLAGDVSVEGGHG